MKDLPYLFEQNRAWAAQSTKADPSFFRRLEKIQAPEFLWIGCSDSRVPANEIVGLAPGELFVHRNIANLVRVDDPNCMAVVQYAVESLGVKHIIVCGHYGCGGVEAVLEGGTSGFVDSWLAPLRAVRQWRGELDLIHDPSELSKRLCEINVREQVGNLTRSDVLHRAWSSGADIAVHGWIYSIGDGLLRDLAVTAREPLNLLER